MKDVIRRLFPKGTRIEKGRSVQDCPHWPPDLFAVSATLVRLSECYSSQKFTAPLSGHRTNLWFFSERYVKRIERLGETWSRTGVPPRLAENYWKLLLKSREVELTDTFHREWTEYAMKLMAIADEASRGIGFVDTQKSKILDCFLLDYYFYQKLQSYALLPHLPWSLCAMVPREEVCVQPKTRTPQVGCTVRSLSHHLALLPPIGEVKTSLHLAISSKIAPANETPLNLLLVPYPYRISGGCFEQGKNFGSKTGLFSLNQKWLKKATGIDVTPEEIGTFIIELIEQASEEVSQIHGVVLPECALSEDLTRMVSKELAKRTNLELFICGSLGKPESRDAVVGNQVQSFIFLDHEIYRPSVQNKHHRWRLDHNQIRRYHLGHILNPDTTWWEGISIDQRECHFYVFRHGASLATLVCEDLARIDPVQTVVRAIGPNLVIVLLMDGPQLEKRWPGRYATVLADDPGSAVLTLTSLGMVRRSVMPGDTDPLEIALWKDSSGLTRELKLPSGAHALAVTLSGSWENNRTLDSRPDNYGTFQLSLSGVRPIRAKHVPEWVDY